MEDDAAAAVQEKPQKKKKKGLMASSIMASRAMAAGTKDEAIEVKGSDSEEEDTVQLMNADLAETGDSKQQENVLPEQLPSQPSGTAEEPSAAGKRTNGSSAKKRGKKKDKVAASDSVAESIASVASSNTKTKRKQRGRGRGK